MGTINARRRKDGTIAYSAQILLMRSGQIVHRESRTFNDRAMAKGWIERRERELDKPGGLEAAKIGKETLGDAIDKYVATSRKKIGKTKAPSSRRSRVWTSPRSNAASSTVRC